MITPLDQIGTKHIDKVINMNTVTPELMQNIVHDAIAQAINAPTPWYEYLFWVSLSTLFLAKAISYFIRKV